MSEHQSPLWCDRSSRKKNENTISTLSLCASVCFLNWILWFCLMSEHQSRLWCDRSSRKKRKLHLFAFSLRVFVLSQLDSMVPFDVRTPVSIWCGRSSRNMKTMSFCLGVLGFLNWILRVLRENRITSLYVFLRCVYIFASWILVYRNHPPLFVFAHTSDLIVDETLLWFNVSGFFSM